MKRYIFIVLALLIIVGLLFYSLQDKKNPPKVQMHTALLQNPPIGTYPIKQVQKAPPPSQVQKKKTPKGKEVTLYEVISLKEAALYTLPRPSIAPIAAIRMHKKIRNENDTLIFPDIEGLDYTLDISDIHSNADGSISTTSAYSDQGIRYSSTMTESGTESFITLSSPKGMYEIELYKGIGYIYRTDAIRKQLQPKPVDDAIILNFSKMSDS